MIKAFLTVLGLLGLLFAAIFFIKAKQFTAEAPQGFPPAFITSATAQAMTWPKVVNASASLQASKGVQVASEVSGTVREILFTSGQTVLEGEPLLVLDDSSEQAELASAEAAAKLARVNQRRARELLDGRAISQSEFDQADASATEAMAQVERAQSALGKKRVLAPFSGTLGIRLVDIGEYLSPGTPIASLQQLDPIYADFALPQQQIADANEGYKITLQVDSYEGTPFDGVIQALNPQLDSATRTLGVRAVLPNPHKRLRPGMFGTVSVIQPEPHQVVAIPSTAISYQTHGNSIFVIKSSEQGQAVEQRFVKLGASRGDFVAVLDGLEPEEEVATGGVFKLSDKQAVVVDNSKALEASLEPTPDNA